MNISQSQIGPDHRLAVTRWLHQHNPTHFLTLATNSGGLSIDKMKSMLKQWDGRVNRTLYGPKWHKHYDELLFYFAFIENPNTNAHWHLLLRFQDEDKLSTLRHAAIYEWRRITPGGSVNLQAIESTPSRLIDYVAKQIQGDLQYTSFVTPDEFRRFLKVG